MLLNVPWVGTDKFIIGRRTEYEENYFIPRVSFFICLIQRFPLKSFSLSSVSMWMVNRYMALPYEKS